MAEHTPHIDFENLPTPSEGFLVTLFITVRNVARSRAFYSEILGGEVVMEEARMSGSAGRGRFQKCDRPEAARPRGRPLIDPSIFS